MGSPAIFAQRLRLARNLCGMTQKELAEKIGTTSAAISAYESVDDSKRNTPTLENLIAIARVLGVSLDYLCGLSGGGTIPDAPEEKAGYFLRAITHAYEVFGDCVNICIPSLYIDGADEITGASIEFEIGSSMAAFLVEWHGVYGLFEAKTIDAETYDSIIDTLCKKYVPRIVKEREENPRKPLGGIPHGHD